MRVQHIVQAERTLLKPQGIQLAVRWRSDDGGNTLVVRSIGNFFQFFGTDHAVDFAFLGKQTARLSEERRSFRIKEQALDSFGSVAGNGLHRRQTADREQRLGHWCPMLQTDMSRH